MQTTKTTVVDGKSIEWKVSYGLGVKQKGCRHKWYASTYAGVLICEGLDSKEEAAREAERRLRESSIK